MKKFKKQTGQKSLYWVSNAVESGVKWKGTSEKYVST